MGFALYVIGTILYFRHRIFFVHFYAAAGIMLLLGVLLTPVLKPLYIGWMRFAFILGWINSRIILCLIFYLIFTPLGLALRLFAKDPLEKKIEKGVKTYWKEKEKKKFSPLQYEHQF